MAKINVKLLGTSGTLEVEASSVNEIKTALGLEGNFTASFNGESIGNDDSISDDGIVTLAKAVKGGKK